jgi:hypothetical protein
MADAPQVKLRSSDDDLFTVAQDVALCVGGAARRRRVRDTQLPRGPSSLGGLVDAGAPDAPPLRASRRRAA